MNFNPSFRTACGQRAETLDPESKQRCAGLPLISAFSQILSSPRLIVALRDTTPIIKTINPNLVMTEK